MRLSLFLTVLLAGGPALASGQTPALLAPGVALPPDTARSRQLLGSLRGFLTHLNQPAAPNPAGPAPARPEDELLLDELRNLDQSRPPLAATTYTTQLLSVVALDSGRYLMQLGSLGLAEGRPVLRASYDLLARPAGGPAGSFTFGSPLRANSRAWASLRVGRCTFRLPKAPTPADKAAARAYAQRVAAYDQHLGTATPRTEVFCCASLPEALGLAGVAYKADYAGQAQGSLSARAPQQLLVLYAEGPLAAFDPHDLWHQRLRNVVPAATINKAVDEGCAFRYGGSWGLSWAQILSQFQAWAATQPNPDWLRLYQDKVNYAGKSQRPLLVSYTLNALLIEELERTQGFGAVRQLLTCGRYEPGNENYLRALNQVAGITAATFNARMAQLVRASRP